MPGTIIETKELTKLYNGYRAVDKLSLSIKEGEIFGLLGPNGAGKTTTILMLLGLTEASSGEVRIAGYDPAREPMKVKRIVGYLPDQVGFYENRTALENIVFTARLNGIDEKTAIKTGEDLLKTVGLAEVGNKKVATFSKGMRQRLGLADVLIKDPQIIILDEPTIGIDPKGVNDFLALIKGLSRERGITVLLSSHLLNQVQKICDRVGIFIKGRLRALGEIGELANELLKRGNIEIRVSVKEELSDQVVGQIKSLSGISEVKVKDRELLIQAKEDLSSPIAKLLIDAGFSLLHLSTKEYGLEDIYQFYFEGGIEDGKAS
ncbi:MAG TPA: ABC transporter ATP-binding protein [Halanaerobiaceae bacterium]|jgi:ABC-2 type transport system ATP-binding protein|nr:ABC transporter ATP-binding protein [Bacillota bacterium]HHU92770.1 ABC transporter ATP-binding protein [Halanaerobiaceae bacterium]HOA40258.1 ABC transporter ATP-binding protein [Halanaerobiales bacterium]HPZ62411.1 ABC transporter ATP-binding protein [Halanaerobiales bacterium]HQD03809.1 ABC transporter ATP-binding protein [Halanaerobiales bacterium]